MTPEDLSVESGSEMPTEQISAGEQVFEKWRKRLGIVLTPFTFVLTYFLCAGLQPEGQKLAAILAAVAVLWISEAVPLPVSALLGAALCVVFGVADAKTVLAYFADPIVFVFVGGFMIARAMMLHGLDRRIALSFLSIPWIGSSPSRIMAGLGLVTAGVSMWVSNSAVTAMMFPIALGILGALHEVRIAHGLARGSMSAQNWPYATGMMLMVAYGASIGGIGTPVGSPPNLIGIGLIRSATGFEISFFRWMAVTVPLFLVMAVVLFTLLYLLHPADKKTKKTQSDKDSKTAPVKPGDPDVDMGNHLLNYIRTEHKRLGPWNREQKCSGWLQESCNCPGLNGPGWASG
jgi:sodium-dependent dicarboxylate transporter 2/3/5